MGTSWCGLLTIDARILLIQQVDPLVEEDASHVEAVLPQPALRLAQGRSDHLGHDRGAVAALHADVERHARTGLGLHAAVGIDRLVLVALLQHVVRRHVGPVDQSVDLQTGYFEHVLRLTQRPAGYVGQVDHLLREGVDRHVDLAARLYLDPRFGELIEHDAPLVGGYVKRVVHHQLQVAVAGRTFGLVERNARQLGHRAPGSVARGDLHEQVGRHRHRQQDQGDQHQIVERTAIPEPVPPVFQVGIHLFEVSVS